MQVKLIQKNIKSFCEYLLNIVLPPRCVVSGENVEKQGMVAPHVWAELSFISDPICQSCGMPFEYELQSEHELQCANCVQMPPPYQLARSAITYNDVSRDLILGFKHGDQMHAVKSFLPWLKNAGAGFLGKADLLVPVPLHSLRLLKRRYNQSGIIAQALGQEIGVLCCPDLLVRIRNTPTQGKLKVNDRHKNVKSAFKVRKNREKLLINKKIVLIDDVYTTGATVKECTKVLLDAGASEVFVLTVARVVQNEL